MAQFLELELAIPDPAPLATSKISVRIDENSPQLISIGTKNAFQFGHFYPYKKVRLESGDLAYELDRPIWESEKMWAKPDEGVMIIVEKGYYVAYTVTCDGEWRQPVFRSNGAVLGIGFHRWEKNISMSQNGRDVTWKGFMNCETKHQHCQLDRPYQADQKSLNDK